MVYLLLGVTLYYAYYYLQVIKKLVDDYIARHPCEFLNATKCCNDDDTKEQVIILEGIEYNFYSHIYYLAKPETILVKDANFKEIKFHERLETNNKPI